MNKTVKIYFVFIVFMFAAAPLFLKADIYIKQKRHTNAFEIMGKAQPAQDVTNEIWVREDKGRIDMGEDKSMIIRLDKNMIYLLDHAKMKFTEMPFGRLDEIISNYISRSDVSEEERAEATKFMTNFMKQMKVEVKVTDTGEKKKIKGWNCQKYIMETKMMMMSATSEIWATEDVKINYDLYRTLGAPFLANQPGYQEILEEMKKVKGLAILTTSTSSAAGAKVKSTEDLVEVKERSAPIGIYDISEGYVKEK